MELSRYIDSYKNRGLVVTLRKILKRIWSKNVKTVWLTDLYEHDDLMRVDGIEFTHGTEMDAEPIARVWPRELPHYKYKGLCHSIRKDMKKGHCIIAWHESDVVGAVWVNPFDNVIAELNNEMTDNKVSVVEHLFVSSSMRGKGISTILINNACVAAKKNDMKQLISFIDPFRVASIKAHQRAGFRNVGTFSVSEILFREHVRFKKTDSTRNCS